MGAIEKIVVNEKEILSIDYRGGKEDDMMSTATDFGALIALMGKPVLVLTTFDDKTYATPRFMRHVEKESGKVIHLIHKMAFVGLSPTKQLILKGYNILFKRNFQSFSTREKAIEYLLDEAK